MSASLSRLYLTLLEGYTWSAIVAVGKYCLNVSVFHLNIWSEEIEDEECLLQRGKGHFPSLEDLKIKCEDHVDYLTPKVRYRQK